MDIVDIYFRLPGPAGQLSNLTQNPFIMDDMFFGSTEGFLQGLRESNPERQKEIFAMHGIPAKKAGRDCPIKNQTLYWQGKPFDRHSEFYQELLYKAYMHCFAQNVNYQEALYKTIGKTLKHSIGKSDPFDTILTEAEFIGILNRIRDEYTPYLELTYSGK
ncbi:hypothetical protein HYQ09_gp186 [Acinetobacter phage vB_AbaM_Konradin]|uniref:Uncharacterized protein n=8 Tax=Lazarusvirus TaxID=2842820 RepID=A0A650EWJ4_9CAUD|nr:hypothetical protein HYQ09_gp186 [Acinetobacter phage vB_AbaM_Konradin]YP_009886232.1 hypothetical protein HYQ20_gp189 [Acinetobacter phage vB_AbaM_Berthold]YP_009886478.1 hypothetical protein HYQ21_gp182 [Acinetobacter phage vB_AbaM_Apostate]YP_009886728.1 hypothetical protein HYQ22_gp189 [Acinetobacter phage vB_AbaM_Kimel]YP_009886976.1 hypothetical protein HYQ23_gp185 [Acinetobacter phage vB_AbaM_Lazarus]QGT54214.1 hypothetical protein Stupor_201 [Acinetobacter phage Stupor]QKE55904.1 h